MVGLIGNWSMSEKKVEIYAKEIPVVETIVVAPSAPQAPETPESYILSVFGQEDGARGIKMLKECENKQMRLDAINWNGNGTWDFGLLQINQIHGYTQEQLADYKFNVDVAYKLFKRAGNSFRPWTCSYVIGDRSFWQ